MKNWKMIIGISLALLMALSMTVSACPSFCNPCKAEYGPFYVAQGETITFTAPSGTGYTYQWTTYKPNGVGGFTATTDGAASTTTITVPDTAQTGDIYGAVVTLTQSHGSGPSCISSECIWLQVHRFTPPSLDDFCIGGASPTNVGKFIQSMPSGEGFTYAWSGVDNINTQLSSGNPGTITNALNGNPAPNGALSAGTYHAVLTISHGTRTAISFTDDFNVYALPSGAITMPV